MYDDTLYWNHTQYHYITHIHFNWIACHASLWELYDIRLKMPRHNVIVRTLSIPHAHAHAHLHTTAITTQMPLTRANRQANKHFGLYLHPVHTYIRIEMLSRLIFHSFQVVLLLRRLVLPHTHSIHAHFNIHFVFFQLGLSHSFMAYYLHGISIYSLEYTTVRSGHISEIFPSNSHPQTMLYLPGFS